LGSDQLPPPRTIMSNRAMLYFAVLLLVIALLGAPLEAFKVGVGQHDMTGPAAQVNFM
jgi:hypothetical protein